MRRGRRAGVLACLLLAAGSASAAPGATSRDAAPVGPHLGLTAGVAEIVDPDPRGLYSISWQDRLGARRVSPWIFAEATTRDLFLGFGGLVDFPVGGGCVLTPSLGIAIHHEHDGLGLGAMIEFRSAIEATWPLGTGRLGAAFLHYSNARIDAEHNPGTEALLLVWMTPIGRR